MKLTLCVLSVALALPNGLALEKEQATAGAAQVVLATTDGSLRFMRTVAKQSSKDDNDSDDSDDADVRSARARICGRGGLGRGRKQHNCDEQVRRACGMTAGGRSAALVQVPQRVLQLLCKQSKREDAADAPEEGDEEAADGDEAVTHVSDDKAASDDDAAEAGEEAADNGSDEEPQVPAPDMPSKRRRPLPEQGFHTPGKGGPKHGELVEHVEASTATEDWGREFGKPAGHRSYWEICKDHPKNRWCQLHRFTEDYADDDDGAPPQDVAPAPAPSPSHVEVMDSEAIPAEHHHHKPEEREEIDWHTVFVFGLLAVFVVILWVGLACLYQGGYLCPSPGVRVLTN